MLGTCEACPTPSPPPRSAHPLLACHVFLSLLIAGRQGEVREVSAPHSHPGIVIGQLCGGVPSMPMGDGGFHRGVAAAEPGNMMSWGPHRL